MDPSSGGRVEAEPTVVTWLECSENPAAAAAVDGKGGGAGANAVEDAAYGGANAVEDAACGGAKCASTRAAACCAACWASKWRCDGCRPGPVGAAWAGGGDLRETDRWRRAEVRGGDRRGGERRGRDGGGGGDLRTGVSSGCGGRRVRRGRGVRGG